MTAALLMLARPGRRSFRSYARTVRDHFAPLASHPAVTVSRALLDRGFPEHLFAQLILREHGGPDGLQAQELAV